MIHKRKAFTLVELLVSIAIIFLLLGLSLISYSSVKDASHSKQCISNIKQLSIAMAIYVADYDSTYPPEFDSTLTRYKDHVSRGKGNTWYDFIYPYINSSTQIECPSLVVDREEIIAPNLLENGILSGYAYNENISKKVYKPSIKDLTLPEAHLFGINENETEYSSLVIVLVEARAGIIAVDRPDKKYDDFIDALCFRSLKEYIQNQPSGGIRHQGGANYSFVDGHVKWFKPEQLNTDEKCDGKTPGFGL